MLSSGITIYPYFLLCIDLRDLVVVLPVFAGIVVLQLVLSRRAEWWPGLILPALWLLWTVAGIMPEIGLCLAESRDIFENFSVLGMGVLVVLIKNIPNLILLVMYFVCHLLRRRKEKNQLKKTRIDDL